MMMTMMDDVNKHVALTIEARRISHPMKGSEESSIQLKAIKICYSVLIESPPSNHAADAIFFKWLHVLFLVRPYYICNDNDILYRILQLFLILLFSRTFPTSLAHGHGGRRRI